MSLPTRAHGTVYETFLIVTICGGGFTVIQWVEPRDAAKYPTLNRTDPQSKMSIQLKLRSSSQGNNLGIRITFCFPRLAL